MKLAPHILISLMAAGLFACAGGAPAFADEPIELPGIHHFFRATTNVFSGSQPEGDAGFAALAKLGVKTIISVDGAKPDVELAAKHGLRYVHLPFGYDGIPTNRVAELAQAGSVLPGPIYVHCHHGKHRGPAAVAVMCLASGTWTANQASDFLVAAGTSPEYPGLFRAVRNFTAPAAADWDGGSTNFPSVAKTSSLVESMVAIDGHVDRLKAVQQAGWQTSKAHPDVSPDHEAVLLWEQLRELARTEEVAQSPEEFRRKLHASERIAEQLRDALREGTRDKTAADVAFKQVSQSCVNCHQRYRNQ
jgi:protein tyrosine phosphatase (PTP) superfamily phosphohydrolase (DUF442 family)